MMEKIKLAKVVIVEGKYDKITLENVIDAPIFTTDGFGIFKNEEKKLLFRRLAKERGLIVFSDPDGAGLVIRNYFNSIIPKEHLTHLYIPKLYGKERRKTVGSKEGVLGVEGMTRTLLYNLFLPYAVDQSPAPSEPITLMTLYDDGFRGKENSEEKRKALLRAAALPDNLSAKAAVSAINLLGGREFYEDIKKKLG
ncbi:MAG: DUF4093 domain-containing protein [Clostridia bacterium]|nr:DUF4093 domain-containing protein [Clostridia bacterium]